MTGQDEDAVPWGRKAAEANRGYPMAHFHYAAPLALCGRLAEARSEVTAGLALAPNFTILGYREDTLSDNATYLSQREPSLMACVWPARRRSDGQLGLSKAGMPEE